MNKISTLFLSQEKTGGESTKRGVVRERVHVRVCALRPVRIAWMSAQCECNWVIAKK